MSKMSPILVGIVGCGRAGLGMHWPELKKRGGKFRVVAAYDFLEERREQMAAATGCRTYGDFHKMINDPDVELVDVASNTLDHVPQATAALKAGKLVFVEKPVAQDLKATQKLMKAAAVHPGKLFVRHNRRFEPAFVHAKEIIALGKLGEVFEIKLNRLGYQRRCDWQTLRECAGGQLLNWGPHIIDHALQFLESPLAKLTGQLRRVVAAGDSEDHVHATLVGENGRIVDVEISGGCAMPLPVYYIAGTKGTLISWDEKNFELKFLDPRVKLKPVTASKVPPKIGVPGEQLKWVQKTIPVKPSHKIDTDSIWDYLYDAIRRGTPFPITNEQVTAVMEVIDRLKKMNPDF